MRIKSKIIEIPAGATIAQMESVLDTYLNSGWVLMEVFNLGTKTYAILAKEIAK